MKKINLILLCLLMLTIMKTANAQTIDEIMKNYDKAIGKESYSKINSIKQTGSIALAMGELNFVKYTKRPNLIRTEIDAMGKQIVQLYDGTNSYANNPFQGMEELQKGDEEQSKNARLQSDFEPPLLNFKDKGSKVELIGKEKVDSVDTYKVLLTTKDGELDYYYINAKTFLPYRLTYKNVLMGLDNNNDLRYLSYKNVNGIMIADLINVAQDNNPMGKELNIKVTSTETNPVIDDSMFMVK